jgi:arsenate reductase (thioredoxin)
MATDMQVEVLVFEGCPHAEPAFAMVREVAARLAPKVTVLKLEVDTPEKAASLGFLGSPSIRVNGRDIEGKHTNSGTLCCRVYEGGQGLPPQWMVEAAMLRTRQPRGLLFLCVANSARSQMAEGIALSFAPPETRIWSAGSSPTRVRPEAIQVMREIGIDISHHRSKAISEVPAAQVDTVITLCAEEVCPVFLGKARRLHWGLSDPAVVDGSEEDRLEAFRKTRDELRRRIQAFLPSDKLQA